MTARTTLACSRLAVLAVLAALLLILACRPAWSPDGKKLLYLSLLAPRQLGVALYDRDTGKATLLTEQPLEDNLAGLAWTPDSKTALVVTKTDKRDTVLATAYGVPASGKPRSYEIAVRDTAADPFAVPPIAIGHYLFVYSDGITRLDLESGESVRLEPKAGHNLCVMRRGDGLCYLSLAKADNGTRWELGSLDPETLAMSPLIQAPEDSPWKPFPYASFTADLSRLAISAQDAHGKSAQAILVFADGRLETVLPLGNDDTVGIGSVHWANDDVTLLLSLCRRDNEARVDSWTLYETTLSGSVERETVILRAPRGKDNEAQGLLFPMALSPDRTIAAFSTAMLEFAAAEDHGLYLLDLTAKERKATRVAFPEKPN